MLQKQRRRPTAPKMKLIRGGLFFIFLPEFAGCSLADIYFKRSEEFSLSMHSEKTGNKRTPRLS
jgi:hypothetical protein